MNRQLILIGGGGHCRSCIDVIEQTDSYTIAGILDQPTKIGQKVLGYPILAGDDAITELASKHSFLVTIGHIHKVKPRIKASEAILAAHGALATIISPHAYVSSHAKIGAGTIIMHGATVNAGARIGNNCIINSHALIEHDAIINDHCHISTGAIINGGVQIGTQTFVGSKTMAKEYITIGAESFIAAGLNIYHDLPSQSREKPL